jgi:acyl-CoA thioesterase
MKQATDQLVRQDRLAQFMGMEIVELEVGRAKVRMEAKAEHCNGLGIVHGGTIFSLADFAFAAACNSHEVPTVAIHADISYVKAALPGVLVAEAKEAVDAKIGVTEVRVTNGEGQLVAIFQGVSYRKGGKGGDLGESRERK